MAMATTTSTTTTTASIRGWDHRATIDRPPRRRRRPGPTRGGRSRSWPSSRAASPLSLCSAGRRPPPRGTSTRWTRSRSATTGGRGRRAGRRGGAPAGRQRREGRLPASLLLGEGGGTRDRTVGWMYERSFRALSKKLLKAMITNDHFFVTLGGHSAAAGHGEFVVVAATTTTDHIDKREEEGGGDGGDRRVFLPFAPAFFLHFRRHRRRRRSQNSPSFSLVKGNNFGQSYMMGK